MKILIDVRARREYKRNMKTNWEARDTRIHNLRMMTQDRHLARIERLEKKAAPMVGELCREGATIYYASPIGGKYVESYSHTEIVDHLIRNKFAR